MPAVAATRDARIDIRVSEDLKERALAEARRVGEELGAPISLTTWIIMVIEGRAAPLSDKKRGK